MTTTTIQISRKELSTDEVLAQLDEGSRVVVTAEVLGVKKEFTLHKSADTYVCDTGFKLLSYEERDGMRQCIERLRLATSG